VRIFRLITKGLVRFASVALIAAVVVALIAAVVQVSLVFLPSAQTNSAESAREVLGSSLSETVEQIEGTYEGTFTINQVTGETPNLANIPAIWFGSYGYLSKRAGRQR
jgi:hypothetical protein